MFCTFLLVFCAPAYVVSENDSASSSLSDRIRDHFASSVSRSKPNPSEYVSSKVFLIPENRSESLFENTTLFLHCGVTKWVQPFNASSLSGNEKNSNSIKLFKRVTEFSTTRNEDSDVTCLVPRNASSSLISVSASENGTKIYASMTCLIRSKQRISEAVRSKNMTYFDFTELFEYSVDRSKLVNVFAEGRYVCLLIYENTVVIPDFGDTSSTTTSVYPEFRITIPDELANELEKAIASDLHLSFIFILLLLCILGGIVLWIMYLLFFVLLPKLLGHYGYHFCCKRHRPRRPKKPNN